MGEERKEACLLCLPRDLALCVALFSFYQLPRKNTSGRRVESLALSLQRRDSVPLAHYSLTGNMKWRPSLLVGYFYIIRAGSLC